MSDNIDHRLPKTHLFTPLANWSVILVEPLTSENVGAVARLCSNFAVGRLQIVNPRCDVCFDGAAGLLARESGRQYLDRAITANQLSDALADIQYSVAMTMQDLEDRPVDWVGFMAPEPVIELDDTACALVLGREDNGLTNDECAMTSCRWSIPLNPENSSMNLAQACCAALSGIQSRLAAKEINTEIMQYPVARCDYQQYTDLSDVEEKIPLATSAEIDGLLGHLESVIDASAFERGVPKEYPLRLIRRLAGRSRMTESDVKVLRGICRRVLNALHSDEKSS